ncbi:MAG TPA: hypothetical protein VFQ61_15965 [Polyangiaceae bacterium]|nr:hypothetical protein [Polyangiaceae bacterium]
MQGSRVLRIASRLLLIAPLLFSVSCGGGQNQVKHANVTAGTMPEGGNWQGVYYSQLYGYLHLLSDGSSANGAWRTTAGDAYGELHGQIEGDLLRFEWVERRIGAVGADANRKGKGYFRYTSPKEGEAHEIVGEWGLGEADAGYEWRAVKQKNMPPNPASVKPDEVEGRVTGVDSWDDGGEEGSDKKDSDSDSK